MLANRSVRAARTGQPYGTAASTPAGSPPGGARSRYPIRTASWRKNGVNLRPAGAAAGRRRPDSRGSAAARSNGRAASRRGLDHRRYRAARRLTRPAASTVGNRGRRQTASHRFARHFLPQQASRRGRRSVRDYPVGKVGAVPSGPNACRAVPGHHSWPCPVNASLAGQWSTRALASSRPGRDHGDTDGAGAAVPWPRRPPGGRARRRGRPSTSQPSPGAQARRRRQSVPGRPGGPRCRSALPPHPRSRSATWGPTTGARSGRPRVRGSASTTAGAWHRPSDGERARSAGCQPRGASRATPAAAAGAGRVNEGPSAPLE